MLLLLILTVSIVALSVWLGAYLKERQPKRTPSEHHLAVRGSVSIDVFAEYFA